MFSLWLTKSKVARQIERRGVRFQKSKFTKGKTQPKKVMKNKRGLPIPFLILILAGAVSGFSILADHGSRGGRVRDDSLQMQTVEQERMAAFYFRILSWLSDVTPRAAEPAKADPQPVRLPQPTKAPQRRQRQGRTELCTLPSGQNLAASKRGASSLN
jgi:hypothetical protein